jgi:DNA-binding beta-propeller fold protein YncE
MTDPVDPTAQPRTVTVDSRTHNIWVVRVSAAAQTVVVYNIIGVRLGTLATRDAEAVPVTFDPYLDRAYLAQSGQIAVADATTLGIFSSLVDAPAVTFGVAVDPNTHDIWMAADRSTTTLDPLGLKIGSWPAGSQQVVVDPVTRRVYALTGGNGLHGQVTAYAADSRAKIGSLLLDSSLSEALDPSTGNLIVSTSTGFTVIANRCA